MKGKWLGLIAICAAAFSVAGCSSGQQLLSIQVTPETVVFGGADPALFAQLTATGTYRHPPATKDITNQVIWSSSIPQVAVVSSTGKVSPSTNCGVSNITASVTTNSPTGNIVSGTMSVTVNGPASEGCPSAPL